MYRIVQERKAGQGKHGDAKRAKQSTQARLTHLSVGIEFTCPGCRLPLCDPLTCFRVTSFVMTLYSKADCCESDVPCRAQLPLLQSSMTECKRDFVNSRHYVRRQHERKSSDAAATACWCTARLTCVSARLFTPSWCLVHMQVL